MSSTPLSWGHKALVMNDKDFKTKAKVIRRIWFFFFLLSVSLLFYNTGHLISSLDFLNPFSLATYCSTFYLDFSLILFPLSCSLPPSMLGVHLFSVIFALNYLFHCLCTFSQLSYFTFLLCFLILLLFLHLLSLLDIFVFCFCNLCRSIEVKEMWFIVYI